MFQFLTYLLHKKIIEMRCSQNLRRPFSVSQYYRSRRLWKEEENDSEVEKILDECFDNFENQHEPEGQHEPDVQPDAENIEENDGILYAVKQFQSKQQNRRCLMPEDLAGQVVVNSKMVPVIIPKEESNETFKCAPG